MSQLQPGESLGPYQIVSQVGKGGMATVYKAFHAPTNRYVAVKVLPDSLSENEEFINRFRQEVRTIANLQHPQILPVFDYGEDKGQMYMVMRYLDSGTLKERMETRLGLKEIDRLFSQLLQALEYAHAHGIVHRDIKPSNALVDSDDNLFLTDFGIAKILEKQTQLTEAGALIGTPDYMSPEQAQGMPLDRRSDIYSLGVILYEMVTGHVPFEAETPLAVILKHIHDPLPPPSLRVPGLSPAIEAVILKSLAKKPEDRFATCKEFLDAWQKAVATANGSLTSKPLGPATATATGTRPAISPATGPVNSARPATTPPSTGSGARDLLIVLAVGGVLFAIVCLLAVAGLGGLSIITNRLSQAPTATQPRATEQVPTVIVENTAAAKPTQTIATQVEVPTSSVPAMLPAPQTATTNLSNTEFESQYPQIVADDNDTLEVVWIDKTARKEGDVYYVHSTGDGGWTKPESISSNTGVVVNGSLRWLTKPDGAQCAVWYAQEWTQRCLNNAGWEDPDTLNVTASWADHPDFAYKPNGDLAAVWFQFSDVYYNGTVISDGRNNVTDVRLVLDDDGYPHVAWIEMDNSDFVVKARYSEDGGTTWGDIKTISTGESNPGLGGAFGMASDTSGNVHLAWAAQNGTLFYAVWTFEGDWSAPLALTGAKATLDLDITSDPDGYAQIAVSGIANTQLGIYYFKQTAEGWEQVKPITVEPDSVPMPNRDVQILFDHDGAGHLVWESDSAVPDIIYARLP